MAAALARGGDGAGPLSGGDLATWLAPLMARRAEFGITRVASLTRLDRVGIPVVQVTRPLALSNAVSQGKGQALPAATAAAFMEAIETWAAERIPESAVRRATPASLGPGVCELYGPWIDGDALLSWATTDCSWIDGWDLLSETIRPVPLALADTVYTVPSPHSRSLPRVTTGLGAGRRMIDAILQAGLEIIERDALVRARRTPYFFERFQVDLSTVTGRESAWILDRIQSGGLVAGAWRIPSAPGTGVYRCHVMETDWSMELAPLPAEGSACRLDEDSALAAALLEACQARLAAISGARDDLTRNHYPTAYDRAELADWRSQLSPAGGMPFASSDSGSRPGIDGLVKALRATGAQAFIVVPLLVDHDLDVTVVRAVAPPLRLWPGSGDA
ncbi:MAG: YcaO-like family protein [Microvirga sp.]